MFPSLLRPVLLAASMVVITSAGAAAAPPFLFSFGGTGALPGQLATPRSIAIHNGEVYVLEYSNGRVSVFDLSGNFQRMFAEGQFRNCQQLTVAPAGYVYVTDKYYDSVQKFTTGGTYLSTWGSTGSADSLFTDPDGIACDDDGNIWVVDRLNSALKEFDANGVFQSKITSSELIGATDVVPTASGWYATIWNTIYTGMRLVDATGSVLAEVAGGFGSPHGLAQAPSGEIYVAGGAVGNRVYVVDPVTLGVITDWGFGDISFPYDVAVAPDGNVYVADWGNDLIKVYGPVTAVETESWGVIKARYR